MMSDAHAQLPSIGNMLRMTFEKWNNDHIQRHAAVLAFYTLFAVAPILLLCVDALGLLYGRDEAEAMVLAQITSFVNSAETGAWVTGLLDNVLPSSANWWVTIGFVLALIFGASSFFGELKIALNQIWRIPLPVERGIWEVVWHRFQAVLLVLLGSLLIFCALLITTWATSATDWLTTNLSLGTAYDGWGYPVLLFLLLTIVFALIYKFVPNRPIEWHNVWIGAAATALLISITRLLISLYFSYSHTTTMFGAASALVVILLSVYYSAQIFFLGAEFTYVYSKTYGAWWGEEESLPEENWAEADLVPEEASVDHQMATRIYEPTPRQPAEPIELAITNIEPSPAPIAQLVPKKMNRFSLVYQRVRNALPAFHISKKPTGSTTEEKPLSKPVQVENDNKTLPSATAKESRKPIAAIRQSVRTTRKRVRRSVSLPIRILRPLREIIIGVGVIGGLSLAALAGIPFWRKRDRDADIPEQNSEQS